jgi:hypothetical protein
MEPSLSIALALRQWLPKVAQFTVPWMSRQDLESGEMWNEQVAAQLDQTTYGIICVTAANQERPWLNFEAGALAKRVVEPARVVPLCIDLEPGALNSGPLASFQGIKLDKEGMRKLVRDIHARRENPMPVAEVDEMFDDTWHRLKAKVDAAKAKAADPQPKHREPWEMLEELVERVRRIERKAGPSGQVGVPTIYTGDRRTILSILRDAKPLPAEQRHRHVAAELARHDIPLKSAINAAAADNEIGQAVLEAFGEDGIVVWPREQ